MISLLYCRAYGILIKPVGMLNMHIYLCVLVCVYVRVQTCIHVISLIAYHIADNVTCECHGLIHVAKNQIGDCIFRCDRTHRGYRRAAAVKRTSAGAVQNQLGFSHRDYKKYMGGVDFTVNAKRTCGIPWSRDVRALVTHTLCTRMSPLSRRV